MRTITLIKGDGIGPEISQAVVDIFKALNAPIEWDIQEAGADVLEKEGTVLPQKVLDSIKKNKVALKAPVTTPIGHGFKSVNVTLRKELDLYVSLRPAYNISGIKTRFDNVDLITVRENTEDLYAGIERKVDDDTMESIKLITRKASTRIAEFAFEYAKNNNRKMVTAVSKANICKLTDGLFLECARKVAEKYPDIKYSEVLVDNLCMQLVQNPTKYDVLLLPNLYGDIVSDLAAGLIGGLGVAQGANIGKDCAVFEAVHGSAPDIKGQNKANPTALLLSSVMMLEYINENELANKLKSAIFKVLEEGKVLTPDLGGTATTTEYTAEIIKNIL
ncbi:MAG: isocitrate/isopropylmalate family dehydrogenase [Candidatus Gastranaerophilales bacterium]|nr:isocitrate/isopropylmalate family dehydrogenase [Candidatus Gastranaerophilales bacterium]